jgi:hypothetical protein
MIDLSHQLQHGYNTLLTWRKRYGNEEYYEKVVVNIFYRKFTMEAMWKDIESCFNTNFLGRPKKIWNGVEDGFLKLTKIYETTALRINPNLITTINANPSRRIANTSYDRFIPLLRAASDGNAKSKEELEYTFIYHLLTDNCILIWASAGGCGLNKVDAIGQMCGLLIEDPGIHSYATIDDIMGQVCVSRYLKDHYRQLPLY